MRWNLEYTRRGGWNVARPTNVTKIALSVAPRADDGTAQQVYYHCGVGTSRFQHLTGGAFGVGLSDNVLDAYVFLVDNYREGDELWMFGFSRGAYTARSVAGLVRNCGILTPTNRGRIHEAYALYRARSESPRGTASTLFRNAYSYQPGIRFIGVWDTVGALGVPGPPVKFLQPVFKRFSERWSFHDTDLSTHVDGAFHALAIDEHRNAFKPTLWTQQESARDQKLEQMWFPGVHSDVGGGYTHAGLSDVALRWMIDKARDFELDVIEPPRRSADAKPALVNLGQETLVDIAPDPLAKLDNSRTGIFAIGSPYYRRIGELDNGNEFISVAAMRRREDLGYAPSNLVDALRRGVKVESPTPT